MNIGRPETDPHPLRIPRAEAASLEGAIFQRYWLEQTRHAMRPCACGTQTSHKM